MLLVGAFALKRAVRREILLRGEGVSVAVANLAPRSFRSFSQRARDSFGNGIYCKEESKTELQECSNGVERPRKRKPRAASSH